MYNNIYGNGILFCLVLKNYVRKIPIFLRTNDIFVGMISTKSSIYVYMPFHSTELSFLLIVVYFMFNAILVTLMVFLQAAMNIGSNAPNIPDSRQPYHASAINPPSLLAPNIVSAPALTPQPSFPIAASTSLTPPYGPPDPNNSANQVTNLVKPSSFFPPPSFSSAPMRPSLPSPMTMPTLHPPLNIQSPYGTPMLQPFPPPNPPPSLTPSSAPALNDAPLISRDKVRDALLMLVQVSFSLFLAIL